MTERGSTQRRTDAREAGADDNHEDDDDSSTHQHHAQHHAQHHETLSAVTTIKKVLKLILSPLLDDQGSSQSVLSGLLTLFVVGGLIGLGMPKNEALPSPVYRTVSACIGYIYFLCWSVSFYPQVIHNYQRKSTAGLSIDFCGLNVLGFSCYAVYNLAFYWSPTVQQMYRDRYGANAEITVQSNDVAFAVHALLLSTITLLQIGYYNRGETSIATAYARPSKPIRYVMIGIVTASLLYPMLILLSNTMTNHPKNDGHSFFNWLDYLYLLSSFKIGISLIKYVPQVLLNIRRQSTQGWSIWNIILDATGGVLSDLQLILDCANMHDFTGITGNLAKFALGSVSILFDIVFLMQHYVIYGNRNPTTTSNTSTADGVQGGAGDFNEPLLANDHNDERGGTSVTNPEDRRDVEESAMV
jgi:cystinosin